VELLVCQLMFERRRTNKVAAPVPAASSARIKGMAMSLPVFGNRPSLPTLRIVLVGASWPTWSDDDTVTPSTEAVVLVDESVDAWSVWMVVDVVVDAVVVGATVVGATVVDVVVDESVDGTESVPGTVSFVAGTESTGTLSPGAANVADPTDRAPNVAMIAATRTYTFFIHHLLLSCRAGFAIGSPLGDSRDHAC
jgi:hypothetical protein